MSKWIVAWIAMAGILRGGVESVFAQEYPSRPVHVATSEAGGAGDLASRVIGQALAPVWGQSVVIENRPANAGESVARAAPDGHTLLHYGNTIWLAPLMRKVQWDPTRDFAPIMMTVRSPNLLVVTPSLPVKSVRELVALAKSRPGQLNYGSSAVGSSTHLAAELFKAMTAARIERINYKGVAPAVTDLIRGEVQLMFLVSGSVMPHIKSGRLRALAVTSTEPSELFPGLTTVSAAGVPGYESGAQFGLFAPAQTPAALVTRIQQDVARVLARTEVRERFYNAGADVVASSPNSFASFLKVETTKWSKLIASAGIRE